jgi:hypothetical protein
MQQAFVQLFKDNNLTIIKYRIYSRLNLNIQ